MEKVLELFDEIFNLLLANPWIALVVILVLLFIFRQFLFSILLATGAIYIIIRFYDWFKNNLEKIKNIFGNR